jgi:hypothetical protein
MMTWKPYVRAKISSEIGIEDSKPVPTTWDTFDASSAQNEKFFLIIIAPPAPAPTAEERRSGKQCTPAEIGVSLFTTWNLCGRLTIVNIYGKPTKKALLSN